MTSIGRGMLFAVAFAAALVAVLFGLRRLRHAESRSRRGPLGAVRKAFWMATATILGGPAACADEGEGCYVSTCYVAADDGGHREYVDEGGRGEDGDDAGARDDAGGVRDDAGEVRDEGYWVECYVPVYEDGEAAGDPDDAADDAAGRDGGDERDGGVESPDADSPDASDVEERPDTSVDEDEATGFASKPVTRQERWARRALLRLAAVEHYLGDPGTHPAVRKILLRDVERLRRRAARIRRSNG